MRRWHLFEFEDLPWLPAVLRNLQTDFLRQMNTALRLYEPVVPLVERLLAQSSSRRIVDLCSGAAGPWEQLLAAEWKVTVTLTDRYPNLAAMAQIKSRFPERLDFCPDPVDARFLQAGFTGTRLLFNGFHHFSPVDAQGILQDAVERRAAIGIFEIAERTPAKLLAVLFGVPLLVFVLTPCIRPLTFARFFWTYCVPVAPFCIVWDGLVSLWRAYSREELLAMAAATGTEYDWEYGRLARPYPAAAITYLLGHPRTSGHSGAGSANPV
ncbi:MAG: hypothetical protein FIB02_01620 [Desulfuromonas sp.]|nr:hypothetical protein [Desulfuromonas sp.]